MKKIDIVLRVVLGLLCVMPILGTLGIFPAPTRDMYTNDDAFAFITPLSKSGYVMWAMSVVFLLALISTIQNRMAIAALLLLPVTINIVGFHAFLDGGLLNAGSSMAVVLAAINVYFLWKNCDTYKKLLVKSN